MSVTIRKAVIEDLPMIQEIYRIGRKTMIESGNPNQWKDGYPGRDLLLQDMQKENLHVICDGGAIRGCFVLASGADPTYTRIEEGNWSWDSSYCTIHRLAGFGGGIFEACMRYSQSVSDYIRIDTHRDNHINTKFSNHT